MGSWQISSQKLLFQEGNMIQGAAPTKFLFHGGGGLTKSTKSLTRSTESLKRSTKPEQEQDLVAHLNIIK